MYEDVLVAVDPHKGHNTLVVLDPAGRRPPEEAEFANTHAGYRKVVRFARRWRRAVGPSRATTGPGVTWPSA